MKELNEVINFFESVSKDLVEAKKSDNKIDTKEYLAIAIKNAPLGFVAAWGADDISKEWNAASREEKIEISERLLPIILNVVAVIK